MLSIEDMGKEEILSTNLAELSQVNIFMTQPPHAKDILQKNSHKRSVGEQT